MTSKLMLTVGGLAGIGCVCFTGMGFVVTPMLTNNLMDAIWGDIDEDLDY